ncbi:MAG: thioredoxin family protein [Armatimonadetes bacterium]|nr:thioredoxin family protein [Armatimonadota bacterium]
MLKRLAAVGLLGLATAALAEAPKIGEPAPGFVLTDLDGKSHDLAAAKDTAKAVLLVWVSVQCPVSNDYNDRLNALYERFKDQGVVFYGLNSNATESVEAARQHALESGFAFPVLKDPDNKIADAYGATKTPEVYILDSSLCLRYHGAVDNSRKAAGVEPEKEYTRRAVEAVLAGQQPDPAETAFFGCSIKRRQ